MSDVRCAVLVLNWNGWRDTIECLESVFRSEGEGYTVIVCDNDSQDGSLERIRAWATGHLNVDVAGGPLRALSYPPVPKPIAFVEYERAVAEGGGKAEHRGVPLVLVRTGGNLGYAGGNNVGIRYALARGDFDAVWLLNNDTVVPPASLGNLLSDLERDGRVGMCGSRIMHYDAPDTVQALAGGSYNRWLALPRMVGAGLKADELPADDSVRRRLAYITGASLMVSRAFICEVGEMSEDYFLYFEELDWALRARGRFRLQYVSDSVVYHKEGRSIGTRGARRKSELADYYFMRNRLKVTRRFYPYALSGVRFALLIAALRRASSGDLRRAGMILQLLREH